MVHGAVASGKIFMGEAVRDVVDDFGFLKKEKRLTIAVREDEGMGEAQRLLRMGIIRARDTAALQSTNEMPPNCIR